MRFLAPVLVTLTTLVSLALPAAGGAKELTSATVCGASGCRTVAKPPSALGSGGDGAQDAIPVPGQYLTIDLAVDAEGGSSRWRVFWIPGADTVAFHGEGGKMTFEHLQGTALAAFRSVTAGVEPYGGPEITSGRVAGEQIDDPSSYLRLLGRPDSNAVPATADWRSVELHGVRPSPWTDAILLVVSPSAAVAQVGGRLVDLTRAEASAAARSESLGAPAGAGGTTRVWQAAAAAGLCLALLLGIVLLRRRLPRSTAAPGIEAARPGGSGAVSRSAQP
jgi:hypothetical protein